MSGRPRPRWQRLVGLVLVGGSVGSLMDLPTFLLFAGGALLLEDDHFKRTRGDG